MLQYILCVMHAELVYDNAFLEVELMYGKSKGISRARILGKEQKLEEDHTNLP